MELVSSSALFIVLWFNELQVNAWSTLDDIVVGGFIAYLGHDSNLKVLSTFWGGSDLMHQMIELYRLELDNIMNIIVTTCKWVQSYMLVSLLIQLLQVNQT